MPVTPVPLCYLFSNFRTGNASLNSFWILFILHSVQVSKTDPSPKREMPTMILFNVVFALRVCKVIVFLFFFLNSFHPFKHLIPLLWVRCKRGLFVSDKTLSESSQDLTGRQDQIILLHHAACQSQPISELCWVTVPVSIIERNAESCFKQHYFSGQVL